VSTGTGWRSGPRTRICSVRSVTAALSTVRNMFTEGAERNKALGIAIASSIAASHSQLLLRGGDSAPAALTGGFHAALWVSGAVALLGVPVTFFLIRKDEMAAAVAATALGDPKPGFAT
jgi:hypothetical protein